MATSTREQQELINGTACVGTFTAADDATLADLGVDLILGQPFLRNVYAKCVLQLYMKCRRLTTSRFNLGNTTIGSTFANTTEGSSIQLLSLTDLDYAFQDFTISREAQLAASLPELPPALTAQELPVFKSQL
jgi:hypothetical protein